MNTFPDKKSSRSHIRRAKSFLEEHPPVYFSLVSLAFFLVLLVGLDNPAYLYFDEPYYTYAARDLLSGIVKNREHPPLGKEIISAFLWLLGDNWISIRLGSLIISSIGLFALQCCMYNLTSSIKTCSIFSILIIGNCLFVTTSRSALLDPFMLGFAAISLNFLTAVWAGRGRLYLNLALAGLFMGLSLASKWSAAPILVGVSILYVLSFMEKPKFLLICGLIFGICLTAAYSITFLPLLFDRQYPLSVEDFVPIHQAMINSLGLLIGGHPYESEWWEWLYGAGQMWLYNGAELNNGRLVILGQNPLAALACVPAVIIGIIRFLLSRDKVCGSLAFLYLLSVGFWAIGEKPVLFLYHYNAASLLALALVSIILSRYTNLSAIFNYRIYLGIYVISFLMLFPAITGMNIGGATIIYQNLPLWGANPNSAGMRKIVGDGLELSKWSRACLNEPARIACKEKRKNIVHDSWRPGN